MTIGSARPASYDAVIVRGAMRRRRHGHALAKQGLRVLAIDLGRYGTDTVSTHALMRAGVVLLHRLGVLEGIRAAGTPVIRSTSFHYDDEVVAIPIKPKNGIEGLSGSAPAYA
jgi:2-polyprenyl-6-methoxyphenol hydroxylase-like FAD-dependent oxidoreductase